MPCHLFVFAVIKIASFITGGNLVAKVRLLDEEDAVRDLYLSVHYCSTSEGESR